MNVFLKKRHPFPVPRSPEAKGGSPRHSGAKAEPSILGRGVPATGKITYSTTHSPLSKGNTRAKESVFCYTGWILSKN